MDTVLLSRIQFGLTAGFHFLFPPLTIGLAWFLAWLLWKAWRSGEDLYRRAARFWLRVFTLSFAVGVATGITLEFQFGTNWSAYSRFVGDIFGAPLAAEGILSFFLESTFVGVLLFGWKRLSPRALWISALMVAVGATLSGFWIIVANSWQQTPAGFHIVGGRAELTDFWAAVFNPSTVPRYLHTIDGALITAAFFVMGISAWFVLKGRESEFAERCLRPALLIGAVASVLQLGLGHYHAIQVVRTQPEKLAAVEGLFETQTRAPALVFGIPDEKNGVMRAEVKIPALLSLLASGDPATELTGLNDFPRDEWPPLNLTFYPFHLMVGLGMYFIGVTLLGLLLAWRGTLLRSRRFMTLALISIPLPFLANELGWISAEVGRQPWAVYRVLRTSEAVSAVVPPGQVALTIAAFALVYGLLFWVWVALLRREVRRGPDPERPPRGGEVTA